MILDGKWLWGTHLTAVQLILKSQFLNFNGLKDTFLVLSKGNTIISESIQVLHVNGNHWVTVSTLDSSNSNFDVTLYDSLHFSLSQDTKRLLASLLKTNKKCLVVKLANTHKQAGSDDCGLFAAAYCTSLAYGQNPSAFVYDQSLMRKHLMLCLETKKMEPLPVIRKRRIGTIILINIEVFYYCRCPDDGTPMVCCDGKNCREWFHISCINKKGASGFVRIVNKPV